MSNDIAIGIAAAPQISGTINKKPPHLVILTSGITKPTLINFISLDKPEFMNGFIRMKGLFVKESREDVCKNYTEILNSLNKEQIEELIEPWHRVFEIKNLIFKAK